ncbi:hypothetical protein H0H87_001883, partial [Tephrocybe sp. NHM501043]
IDPSYIEEGDERVGSLVKRSLLRNIDLFGYVGREFECRHIGVEEAWDCLLGDELSTFLITQYKRGYASAPLDNSPTAFPMFGIKDKDGETMFLEIIEYLKSDNVPTHRDTDSKRKAFIRKTKRFFLYEERLWKIERE